MRPEPSPSAVKAAQTYLSNLSTLKQKADLHSSFEAQMKDHLDFIANMSARVKTIKKANAVKVLQVLQGQMVFRKACKEKSTNLGYLKSFGDHLKKLQDDFNYLLNPSRLPTAIEAAMD